MKSSQLTLSVCLVAFCCSTVFAQPPNGFGGGQRGGQRGGGNFMATFPVYKALDANGDGTISAKEIENAVAALKKLDKNKDGELSREEIGPTTAGGQGGMRRGGPGGGRPGGAGGAGRPGGGGRPQEVPSDLTKMFDDRDKDGDGKISK
ncbi:MAG: hypothetical protein AAF394_08360, partial [Planctomycetota bacterium]